MVRARSILKRTVIVVVLLCIVTLSISYRVSLERLTAARMERRCHEYGHAEKLLASCWNLPGLVESIVLEDQLIAVQQGDLRNERELLARTANRTNEAVWILEAIAKGRIATFDLEGAVELANSIIERDIKDAKGYWIRGIAHGEMQKDWLAREDLEKALEMERGNFELRRTLAGLLHKQGFVRKAIDIYQELAVQRPEDNRILLALSACLHDESRCDEANEIIVELLSRQPDSVEGLVTRGRIALRQQDQSVAEQFLQKAISVCPEHVEANQILRTLLRAQNREDDTLNDRIQQIEKQQAELKSRHRGDRKNANYLSDLGSWMTKTGHGEESVGWYYLALKADSKCSLAHLGLMKYFEKSGQPIRAALHAQLGGDPSKVSAEQFEIDTSRRDQKPTLGSKTSPINNHEEASHESVYKLCAACHAFPAPDTMPRSTWRKEVSQAFVFFRDSALGGDYPSLESVVSYYEKHSPEKLDSKEQPAVASKPPFLFEKRGSGWMSNMPLHPGITNANLASLLSTESKELLLCDTRLDVLLILKPYDKRPGGTVIPQVASPCHTTVCDLDRDGIQDVLVASIGSFFPTDDKLGKVTWLRARSPGQFDAIEIASGLGRVTDVQVADFSGDGKLDLVVAVFGWRTGGEIIYMENQTTDWASPEFKSKIVETRNGAIHVPVVDLNHDGLPDFVSVISQQHETIVAYLNDGAGSFRSQCLFAADHPTFGCSGIEVVDLDGDKDLDVLLTNGDVLDAPYVLKPYHGIQWLENNGTFPFTLRRIASMYGVARAVAADFDGDGDQDVAAVSFLPEMHFPERTQLPSVVLMEQRPEHEFVKHILETGNCDHYSCAAGDWDNDGRVDLAITNYAWSGSRPIKDAAMLWHNVTSK